MITKTNIRALCEEAFLNVSSELDREQAEKTAILVVESNLMTTKEALNKRLSDNNVLRNHLRKEDGLFNSGGIAVLDTINRSLCGQVEEIESKLRELNVLKSQNKIAKIFE